MLNKSYHNSLEYLISLEPLADLNHGLISESVPGQVQFSYTFILTQELSNAICRLLTKTIPWQVQPVDGNVFLCFCLNKFRYWCCNAFRYSLSIVTSKKQIKGYVLEQVCDKVTSTNQDGGMITELLWGITSFSSVWFWLPNVRVKLLRR